MTPRITLKSKKDEAVRRYHPWVFSGAIKEIEGNPGEGDWVEVYSNKGSYLASGHFQSEGSIAVRLLTWDKSKPDAAFWQERLRDAFALRKRMGLTSHPDLNAYRLIFAEGDLLPGLIIDHYDGHLVIQCHSTGMTQALGHITEALQTLYGSSLKGIYNKSESTMKGNAGGNTHLMGDASETMINEYGSKFTVNWEKGQKTGFFVDQRENRRLVGELARGKRVLNTFCYTGGFSVAALHGGATLVHSVDSSAYAIGLTEEHIRANGFNPETHQSFVSDTLDFLRETDQAYDLIILDPPAYAKHLSARHNAVQGYKRLNAAAMAILPPGGLLMTFSCSQVVGRGLFESTIMAAALTANRPVKILARLSQPPDHPVSIYHPEGEYLKGLLLSVG
ncbi:MAG: class I SAM-dependent rRNA methyltransferase [Bacteroidales bacterium]